MTNDSNYTDAEWAEILSWLSPKEPHIIAVEKAQREANQLTESELAQARADLAASERDLDAATAEIEALREQIKGYRLLPMVKKVGTAIIAVPFLVMVVVVGGLLMLVAGLLDPGAVWIKTRRASRNE